MAKKPTPAELSVVYRDVRTLIPYARNARQHSPEQVQIIAGLMREFGWTNPVLLDGKKGVVAGHGRIAGARLIWDAGSEIVNTPAKWMAPCIDISHWTEAQKRAYVLADNASAEQATWNDELRALELVELREAGFDIETLADMTAIPVDDISALLQSIDYPQGEEEQDYDNAPEPPANPVTRPGDLWLLGGSVKCPKCGKDTPIEKAARKP